MTWHRFQLSAADQAFADQVRHQLLTQREALIYAIAAVQGIHGADFVLRRFLRVVHGALNSLSRAPGRVNAYALSIEFGENGSGPAIRDVVREAHWLAARQAQPLAPVHQLSERRIAA